MANITMSTSEVFDIHHDIKDFCQERGKELTSAKLKHDAPVRSTSEENYQPNQLNPTRPRAATMDSSDTRRSGGRASRSKYMLVDNPFFIIYIKKPILFF
jgi:hypothetical protein